jgi:hypothetical protein
MWRVVELERGREDGWLRLAPRPEDPRVLAAADGDRIVAHDRRVTRVDGAGRERWERTLPAIPGEALVSGDRLLLLTRSLDYHAWGHLGPALLFDLAGGEPVAELRGERGAALADGSFVLGLGGYDVFDAWRHDRDGRLTDTWRSFGHFVADPDGGVRVVECDRRIRTASRVVRLLADGRIERGPALVDGQSPRPVVLHDGTIVVLDAGRLRAVDRALAATDLAELAPVPQAETWRFAGELLLEGGLLRVALVERPRDPPLTYTSSRWTFRLSATPG